MIKKNIKDTYELLDYLLDLYNYYVGLSCKNTNKIIKLENDKRYKKDSYCKSKKMDGLKQYNAYITDKMNKINDVINGIKNGNIKKIEIDFM